MTKEYEKEYAKLTRKQKAFCYMVIVFMYLAVFIEPIGNLFFE